VTPFGTPSEAAMTLSSFEGDPSQMELSHVTLTSLTVFLLASQLEATVSTSDLCFLAFSNRLLFLPSPLLAKKRVALRYPLATHSVTMRVHVPERDAPIGPRPISPSAITRRASEATLITPDLPPLTPRNARYVFMETQDSRLFCHPFSRPAFC